MSTATTPKRPQALAVKDLSHAVEKAVKLVGDKHKVKFGPEFHVGPIIMGRQLLQAEISTSQAEQLATEITQHLTQGAMTGAGFANLQFEPTVLVRNRLILCGFIPGPIPEIEQQF